MERGFSGTLAALRKSKGLSQRTAAADLHISQALLSHYENGAREPGLPFLSRACDYYGVTADYMLGRSELPQSQDSGWTGDVAAASSCVSASLRELDDPRLTLAVERCILASLLAVLSEITMDSEPGLSSALKADMALCQVQVSRLVRKLTDSGRISLSPSGLEGRRLMNESAQRIGEITDNILI